MELCGVGRHRAQWIWRSGAGAGKMRLMQERFDWVITMPKAVLDNGEIKLLEPLPREWREGEQLRVEMADEGEPSVEEIDRDFALLGELCANSDPAEEAQRALALQQAREQAKMQVRRQVGLN